MQGAYEKTMMILSMTMKYSTTKDMLVFSLNSTEPQKSHLLDWNCKARPKLNKDLSIDKKAESLTLSPIWYTIHRARTKSAHFIQRGKVEQLKQEYWIQSWVLLCRSSNKLVAGSKTQYMGRCSNGSDCLSCEWHHSTFYLQVELWRWNQNPEWDYHWKTSVIG